MKKITYEEKMDVLDNILETIKNYQTTYTGSSFEQDIVVLECIKEDVNQMHQLEEQCQKRQDKEVADIYEEMFLK